MEARGCQDSHVTRLVGQFLRARNCIYRISFGGSLIIIHPTRLYDSLTLQTLSVDNRRLFFDFSKLFLPSSPRDIETTLIPSHRAADLDWLPLSFASEKRQWSEGRGTGL
jgi:hypothetical protein